ncbi:hypothetical protein S40293_10989 [Stachybotrys chartarum IBT 40293]|nr:hypothetical protein S40293_10989 [Stachybotrys chartarum IBT 40293]
MLDIPWLINRENINGNMAFNRRHSSEAVHNYYYNYQEPKAPWYQRKRYFYSAILLLAAIVIGAAVTLGVVLSQPRGDEVAAGELGSSSGVLTGTSTPVSDGDAATFTVGVEIISTLVTSVEPSTTAETTSSSSEQPAVSISVPTASSTSVSPPQPISTGSSLAASYVTTGLAEANRRLIVWQDEDDQLVVHEDADGRSLYRISDKLPSLRDTVRRNTPLSLVEDDIGNAHLFYLDIDGQIRHLVQPAAAYWRQYDMLIKDDLITPHEMSPLSATFHETKGQDSMLVLAYLSTDRQLRLVLSQNPQDEDSWRVHETQGLVVAETDPVGLAMVSGWHDTTGDAVTEDRSLFIAVQGEDEVLPFECNNVRIERFGCLWMNETFAGKSPN